MVKYKTKPKALPDEFLEGDELEVAVIHDDDHKYRTQWYLVQWKGWPAQKDWTWQSRDDLLPGSKTLLQKYDKEHDITGYRNDLTVISTVQSLKITRN